MQDDIVNTQYLYINSSNRSASEYAYDFSIDLPIGMVQCNQDESLCITVTHFCITKNWYYVNSTNNNLVVKYRNQSYEFLIPPANYTYKRLAQTINAWFQAWSPAGNYLKWDSNLNMYIFDLVEGVSIDFSVSNSPWYILGFNKSVVSEINTRPITSDTVLRTNLSQTINVYVDNLTPDKNVSALENSVDNSCVPSNCIMSTSDNFAPFETFELYNQNNWFKLNIKEKVITKLRLTMRDEFRELQKYITDYNVVIRIDTISHNDSLPKRSLKSLEEMVEYLRLQFVASNLNKI